PRGEIVADDDRRLGGKIGDRHPDRWYQTCEQTASNPYDVRPFGMIVDMDATDWAIIRILQDDARVTNRDLAARIHVSTSTSSERTRALHAAGVISGYHASIAMDAL